MSVGWKALESNLDTSPKVVVNDKGKIMWEISNMLKNDPLDKQKKRLQ